MDYETEVGRPKQPFPWKAMFGAMIVVGIAGMLYLAYNNSSLLSDAFQLPLQASGLFGIAFPSPAPDANNVQALYNVSVHAELQLRGTHFDVNNTILTFDHGAKIETETQTLESAESVSLNGFSGIVEWSGKARAAGSATSIESATQHLSFKQPQELSAEGESARVENVSVRDWKLEASGVLQSGALSIALDNDRMELQNFFGTVVFDSNRIVLDGNVHALQISLKDKNIQVK